MSFILYNYAQYTFSIYKKIKAMNIEKQLSQSDLQTFIVYAHWRN